MRGYIHVYDPDNASFYAAFAFEGDWRDAFMEALDTYGPECEIRVKIEEEAVSGNRNA